MKQHYTRRRVLALTASTGLVGLAGCGSGASAPAETGTEAPTETATQEATTARNETTPQEETADENDATTQTVTETAEPPANDGNTVTEILMITDGKGSYFDPIGLLVEPGTTVTFVNDSGTHATNAYHPDFDVPLRMPESAEPWKSELYSESGATFEVTLETPGVYDFYCPPHESLGMVGRLVVGEPRGGPGTTEPTEIPPAARESLPTVDAVVENDVIPGP